MTPQDLEQKLTTFLIKAKSCIANRTLDDLEYLTTLEQDIEELKALIEEVGNEAINQWCVCDDGSVTVYDSGDKYADSQEEPCSECDELRTTLHQLVGKEK